MAVRLMAQYPELERNENRFSATEVCNMRLMRLVKNTGMSYKSIARR